jgi:hypothetical protein
MMESSETLLNNHWLGGIRETMTSDKATSFDTSGSTEW